MQISDSQTDENALASLGADAVQLLRCSDFSGLAQLFGYAVALGREPATAIQEDLASSLSELSATGLDSSREHSATVKYFEQNDSGLFALVECAIPANNGTELLLELVVTTNKHVGLEQISAAA
jgi:hypothetical protein